MWRLGQHAMGGIHKGETIKIPASKAVRFHAGKAVKDVLNPPKGAARKKSVGRSGTLIGRG